MTTNFVPQPVSTLTTLWYLLPRSAIFIALFPSKRTIYIIIHYMYCFFSVPLLKHKLREGKGLQLFCLLVFLKCKEPCLALKEAQ